MEAILRTYPATEPVVIFIQRFPDGLNNSRTETNTISGYPSFRLQDPDVPVGYLSFGSLMFGDLMKKTGIWGSKAEINDGLDGSGPLVLFDKDGNALLISAYDNFMAASMSHEKVAAILNWGIMGGVDSLPAGFEYKTIAYCSSTGIGDAFAGWGDVMRRVYGKTADVIQYHQSQDLSLTHLGYWTDNGAYYYYHTEKGKNYEDTLLDVKKYANDNHIPYSYFQLDSWFYPKDRIKAVTTWDAMESIFPKGIRAFQEKLQLPLVAHNRYWSVNTTYAKQHGGLFDFIIGKRQSLPASQIFWDYLLGHAREVWGLITYEQDWLNVQLLNSEILNTNLTMGKLWLSQMAQASLRHGLKIQYCMAQCRHALQSLEFPTVTQARVSNDYHLNPDQWKIGVTSHFADAVGVSPSKDTFWTTSNQPGNRYGLKEHQPILQGVVATLSRGPVGPGDMIDGTNMTSLMRCCNRDGLILKPSKPALAIDDQIMEMAFTDGQGASGEVWTTYSRINGLLHGVILAASLTRDFTITAKKAGFLSQYAPQFTDSMLYTANGNDSISFDKSTAFTIKASDCVTDGEHFCLFYTAPVLTYKNHTIVILGDLSKWVPMSEERILHIWQEADGFAVTVRGAPGEVIELDVLLDGARKKLQGVADDHGCFTVTLVSLTNVDDVTITAAAAETSTTTATSTTKCAVASSPPTTSTTAKITSTSTSSTTTWNPIPPGLDCRFKPPPITTPKSPLTSGHQSTTGYRTRGRSRKH